MSSMTEYEEGEIIAADYDSDRGRITFTYVITEGGEVMEREGALNVSLPVEYELPPHTLGQLSQVLIGRSVNRHTL